jgi:hypothetical protein
VGELFRDRRVLDYLTVDRITPVTLSHGLLFFVYALKFVDGLPVDDFETLYTRFIAENENPDFWRAWWSGLRVAIANLDAEVYRMSVLAQFERVPWQKLCVQSESENLLFVIHHVVENALQTTATADGLPKWDYTPYVKTLWNLLKTVFAIDLDDRNFREGCAMALTKIFRCYPADGAERTQLAERILGSATMGPMAQRGGDLFVLRALLFADAADTVTNWKREECVRRLCMFTPSLPEVILGELAAWKKRQYSLGQEHAERGNIVPTRLHNLLYVLNYDRIGLGDYTFPREVLEEFWTAALLRPGVNGNERQFWGGDTLTEMMRLTFFHVFARDKEDFRRYSALVYLSLTG